MGLELKNPGLMPGVSFGQRDSTGKVDWVAPNNGKYLLSNTQTYLTTYSSLAGVFRSSDDAVTDSHFNSRAMRRDLGVRECIDSRQRSVSLLDWHIKPETDDAPASHTEFCMLIERCVQRIRKFCMYRYNVQNAIWYGKCAIQHSWRSQIVDGKSVYLPTGWHQDDLGWRPLHGDKLVFRQLRPFGQMPPGSYEGQLGIRVGNGYQVGQSVGPGGRWKVQSTDYGMAYFLSPAERRLMLVHKHQIEDAAYEDGLNAGSQYGQGIRSVIYWEWVQKQETMAFLVTYLERMAGGIQIWKYPQGNQQAEAEARAAAENYNSGQQHILLVPVPAGEQNSQYAVEINEPGFGGIEIVQNLIHGYFEHRIKRYILGQVLSSESEATGLGSGVAELHQDTLLQILKYDANNAEETLTYDLVESIIKINVQKGVWADPGFQPRFVLQTENPDVDKILQAWSQLIDRGLRFRKSDLYDLVGAAIPGDDDDCLEPPQQGQEGPGAGGMPGMEMPGGGGAPGGEPPGDGGEDGPPENTPREKADETDDSAAGGSNGTPHRYRNGNGVGFTRDALLDGWRVKRVVKPTSKGTK